MWVAAWVPAFVDPVDYAGQPALNGDPACQAMEASAESLGGDLARIGRTDRRYVVSIEQTGLEERHAVVKLDAVHVKRILGDAERVHALAIAQALVCDVVDGEHGRHSRALPTQIRRRKTAWPVIHMQQIRLPVHPGTAGGDVG